MPFVSKAHRTKMKELLAAGAITLAQFEAVAEGTPDELPDRKEGQEDEVPGASSLPKKKTISPFW